ncbi:uncharacterized protein AC631_03526 [Debaryomyces fabryi]|uniref:Serine aminopeptidase S33 domain-containing protein n=1 Tax=Debaryomyces fabryi TaxID=58627 RepID=A0A0V1PWZ3_9ASCO|nr:uncharacterized protein AC631_03526 [Debaryomyces fabryi]KSA00707.1 hypothetical protein AC631_03526 [Debaryomyces fabryi]CUM52111.1 unnamed protein product [Debaryomyces fabryi]
MPVEIPYKTDNEPKIGFIEFDKANFKTVTWKAPESIPYKGRIIYVHGFSEHATIYTEYFDKLSQKGYDIFFFDQRGAGETSPGDQVGKTDEAHTFNDLDFMIKHNLDLKKDSTEKFFLMGHLMGGGIVLNYAIKGKYREHIKGIVVCAPLVLLHPKTQPNFVVRALSPLINKLVPNLKIDSKLNYDYITSNEGWKNYIMKHDTKLIGTVRQFFDMFARGEALTKPEFVSKFNPETSLLLVHGTNDNINWIDGTRKFYRLVDDKIDKSFSEIKDGRHSLFIENETIFKDVFDKVLTFLNSH